MFYSNHRYRGARPSWERRSESDQNKPSSYSRDSRKPTEVLIRSPIMERYSHKSASSSKSGRDSYDRGGSRRVSPRGFPSPPAFRRYDPLRVGNRNGSLSSIPHDRALARAMKVSFQKFVLVLLLNFFPSIHRREPHRFSKSSRRTSKVIPRKRCS